jgi:hypothetical protein
MDNSSHMACRKLSSKSVLSDMVISRLWELRRELLGEMNSEDSISQYLDSLEYSSLWSRNICLKLSRMLSNTSLIFSICRHRHEHSQWVAFSSKETGFSIKYFWQELQNISWIYGGCHTALFTFVVCMISFVRGSLILMVALWILRFQRIWEDRITAALTCLMTWIVTIPSFSFYHHYKDIVGIGIYSSYIFHFHDDGISSDGRKFGNSFSLPL